VRPGKTPLFHREEDFGNTRGEAEIEKKKPKLGVHHVARIGGGKRYAKQKSGGTGEKSNP